VSEQRADFNPLNSNYFWEHDNLRHWCSTGLNLKDEIALLKENDVVLDVGSGKGLHALLLGYYGCYVYSLDANHKETPDFHYDLNYPLGILKDPITQEILTFDAITCHHTLEHVSFTHFPRIINDFHALLKPQGYLFITLPMRCRPFALSLRLARWFKSLVKRQLKTFTTSAFHYWELSRQHKPRKIINLVEGKGFSLVAVRDSHYNPFELRFIFQKRVDQNE